MLRSIIHSSSKFCTTRTVSSFYPCSSCMRSLSTGAVENNNITNKESKKDTELKSAKGKAERAIHKVETCVIAHQEMVRDVGFKMTHLEKAIESGDIPQILAAVKDLNQNLDFSGHSSRNDHGVTCDLTARLLKRFGGKTSIWMGRNLRVLQMKLLNTNVDVDSLQVSDRSANLTLAKTIVALIVLRWLYYN